MQTLGSTGLPVSHIGLGLAALGRPGYITLEVNDRRKEMTEKSREQPPTSSIAEVLADLQVTSVSWKTVWSRSMPMVSWTVSRFRCFFRSLSHRNG